MSLQAYTASFTKDVIRISSLLWKADKPMALTNTALQLILSFLPIASLYYLKALIETLTTATGNFDTIAFLIIVFGIIQFVTALTNQFATYVITIHQLKLTDYLSEQVLKKATEIEYKYYENPTYHDTLHLAQQQSLYKASQLLSHYNSIVLNSMSLIFLAGFFFTLHSLFAIIFIIISIPLALIKWHFGQSLAKQQSKLAPSEREANYRHTILTGINTAKEVRTLGYAENFIGKFKQIRTYIYDEKKILHKKLIKYSLLAETIEVIIVTFIFMALAKSTWDKSITIGVFVIYIQGFQRLQTSSRNFLQSLVQLLQQRIFLKDLFTFFDIPTHHIEADKIPFPAIHNGIEVSNVSFTYPDTDTAALQGVSVKCVPGNIIAIVGENGSGKSTLVKLLSRLYHLQSGKVTLENHDIETIDINDYCKNSTFIFQDFEKYFLTVEENITLGTDGIKTANIEIATTLSGAYQFIPKLSKGYQSRLGKLFQGSEQLSGGEWQKLVLSRIFYRDSKLVVLDEPTSALDAIAELELLKNIKDTLDNKIVILISHRLYNLKMADYIYVMRNGRIAEEGSFDDLLTKRGIFKSMYDAQKL